MTCRDTGRAGRVLAGHPDGVGVKVVRDDLNLPARDVTVEGLPGAVAIGS
jgi:hypothetical protein